MGIGWFPEHWKLAALTNLGQLKRKWHTLCCIMLPPFTDLHFLVSATNHKITPAEIPALAIPPLQHQHTFLRAIALSAVCFPAKSLSVLQQSCHQMCSNSVGDKIDSPLCPEAGCEAHLASPHWFCLHVLFHPVQKQSKPVSSSAVGGWCKNRGSRAPIFALMTSGERGWSAF